LATRRPRRAAELNREERAPARPPGGRNARAPSMRLVVRAGARRGCPIRPALVSAEGPC
jgi:hypothetical protein